MRGRTTLPAVIAALGLLTSSASARDLDEQPPPSFRHHVTPFCYEQAIFDLKFNILIARLTGITEAIEELQAAADAAVADADWEAVMVRLKAVVNDRKEAKRQLGEVLRVIGDREAYRVAPGCFTNPAPRISRSESRDLASPG